MKIIEIEGKTVQIVPNGYCASSVASSYIADCNANQNDEAFFLTNLSSVVDQWQKWQCFMPKILPHYAIKANPDKLVLKLLALLGANFDAASKGEIQALLALGISANRIVFSNTTKSVGHLKYARAAGVDLTVFDNLDELKKIKQHFPAAKLLLRIKADDKTALIPLDSKFGCHPKTEAKQLLEEAAVLNLNVVGVSFHTGSWSRNPQELPFSQISTELDIAAYADAVANAKFVFDEAAKLGFSCTLLDIGGGYPGYCTKDISLEKISMVVNSSLSEFFGSIPGLTIISEPGQFFVCGSTVLCINVIGKRLENNSTSDMKNSEALRFSYYVNDGVFSSFSSAKDYGIREPILHCKKKSAEKYWCRLFGQTCDPIDVVEERIELPELDIGDWLICQNMGAYAESLHTNFNGFSAPQVRYIIEERHAWQLNFLSNNGHGFPVDYNSLEVAEKKAGTKNCLLQNGVACNDVLLNGH